MKRALALLVALSIGSWGHAETPGDLMSALNQLRDHVEFVDLTREGRMIRHGETLMKAGFIGIREMPEPNFDDDDPSTALLIWGVAALVAIGVGGAVHLTGRAIRNAKPPPVLDRGRSAHYMTAAGLNQFMRFPIQEQFDFASSEPALSAFLIKLNDSYNLVKYYRLMGDEREAMRLRRFFL